MEICPTVLSPNNLLHKPCFLVIAHASCHGPTNTCIYACFQHASILCSLPPVIPSDTHQYICFVMHVLYYGSFIDSIHYLSIHSSICNSEQKEGKVPCGLSQQGPQPAHPPEQRPASPPPARGPRGPEGLTPHPAQQSTPADINLRIYNCKISSTLAAALVMFANVTYKHEGKYKRF